jgi:hypothetical protein
MPRRRRRAAGERGQSLAEFALIAPLLFILFFGLMDTARLFQAWVMVQHGAREGARYGVTGRTDCALATPDRPSCIEYMVRQNVKALNNDVTDLDVSMRSWSYPTYADPPVNGSPGEQCDALEVQVDYDFTPATPLTDWIFGSVSITARERLVNEPFGPCN